MVITEANTTTYPDLIQAYKVTLNGVTASGDDIYLSDNNIAYVKTGATITLTTKNGYTVTSPAIINSDETISTTLDDTKNYIFGTEGNYTVASADNVKTNNYPDLMQVHKITVPEGVNVTSEKYEVGSDTQIGDATSQFKGTATLGAGVKVSFNGNDTIEVTSGEITFNADTSTVGSLDSGAITINDGTITLSATSETIYF